MMKRILAIVLACMMMTSCAWAEGTQKGGLLNALGQRFGHDLLTALNDAIDSASGLPEGYVEATADMLEWEELEDGTLSLSEYTA